MSVLMELGNDQGYLKAGFLGFQKSGKTYTSALLAIGVRQMFGLEAPIAMFDSEGGSPYIAQMIERATGRKPVGKRSRSFDDLLAVARECEQSAASVLIVDSISHVWRELCDAYLKQLNAQLASKGRSIRTRLEFPDWSHIKAVWSRWTDFYLNSRLHIIVCGRAGYEWDFEEREDGTGKDLVKTGIKMKVEGEFGYEPSLLVQMQRDQVLDGQRTRIVRRAVVIGDRFAVLDGQECEDPTFAFFEPHIALLRPGAHAPVDTEIKTDAGVEEDGNVAWTREKRDRAIFAEEIQGALTNAWPGQTGAERKAKLDAIDAVFGTRSWTKVENLSAQDLRAGLERMREHIKAKLGEAA